MLTGETILCIGSIDWDFNWQVHQEVASALAAQGNRVLFVETTGVRVPTLRDLPRLRLRLRNSRWLNRRVLFQALGWWLGAIGSVRPLVFAFLPTPLAPG